MKGLQILSQIEELTKKTIVPFPNDEFKIYKRICKYFGNKTLINKATGVSIPTITKIEQDGFGSYVVIKKLLEFIDEYISYGMDKPLVFFLAKKRLENNKQISESIELDELLEDL